VVQTPFLVQDPFVASVADGSRWNTKAPSRLSSRKVRAHDLESVKNDVSSRSPSMVIPMIVPELLRPAMIRPLWKRALREAVHRHSGADGG
jgi:hypothetical protein